MRLLLDTCTFIWLAAQPDRLSARSAEALDDDEADLHLSDVAVWEISLKWRARKIVLPRPPRIWIEEQRARWGLSSVAIKRNHIYRESELAELHRDPFDRLLVSQAIEEGLTIVTPDPAIARYPAAVLW